MGVLKQMQIVEEGRLYIGYVGGWCVRFSRFRVVRDQLLDRRSAPGFTVCLLLGRCFSFVGFRV